MDALKNAISGLPGSEWHLPPSVKKAKATALEFTGLQQIYQGGSLYRAGNKMEGQRKLQEGLLRLGVGVTCVAAAVWAAYRFSSSLSSHTNNPLNNTNNPSKNSTTKAPPSSDTDSNPPPTSDSRQPTSGLLDFFKVTSPKQTYTPVGVLINSMVKDMEECSSGKKKCESEALDTIHRFVKREPLTAVKKTAFQMIKNQHPATKTILPPILYAYGDEEFALSVLDTCKDKETGPGCFHMTDAAIKLLGRKAYFYEMRHAGGEYFYNETRYGKAWKAFPDLLQRCMKPGTDRGRKLASTMFEHGSLKLGFEMTKTCGDTKFCWNEARKLLERVERGEKRDNYSGEFQRKGDVDCEVDNLAHRALLSNYGSKLGEELVNKRELSDPSKEWYMVTGSSASLCNTDFCRETQLRLVDKLNNPDNQYLQHLLSSTALDYLKTSYTDDSFQNHGLVLAGKTVPERREWLAKKCKENTEGLYHADTCNKVLVLPESN